MAEYNKILVTTDFSEYSKVAVHHAISMAEKFNAEIILLHVLEPIITPVDFAWGPMNISDEWEQNRVKHSEDYLEQWIRNEFPKNMAVSSIIAHGTPIREIIHAIEEQGIDLVVMATHGQTGIAHVLFGSTTEKVVRRSPVPVLTVRDPAHQFTRNE